jgi:hypothetical protein
MRTILPIAFVFLAGCFEELGSWMEDESTPSPSGADDEQQSTSTGWAWVEAGREVTCALARTDGSVECWGDLDSWDENRDTWAVRWSAIDSGSCEFCGLTDAGEVRCWGCREDLTEDFPSGQFQHIETSLWTACAAPASGPIECWGTYWEGDGDPEGWTAPDGPVLDISVARTHACVIMTDHSLFCFGNLPSPPTGTFTQIDAGEEHHCGLRLDGTVTCWGDDSFGQVTDVPPGSFVELTAGGAYNCALDAAGEVTCWGKDTYGILLAPGGPFRQISAGGSYTCGIRDDDDTIHCWGYNHWGQFPT